MTPADAQAEAALIILPLPPSVLSPNRPPGSRGRMMRKARAARSYRQTAMSAAIECGIETGPWEFVGIQATFFHKTKRRRDDVNHLAMLKPAYDGIVDSGLIVDDSFSHLVTLPAAFKIDTLSPRVELLIDRYQEMP